MNPETEREIWRRVQQTERLNAEEILLPERLETAIQEQRLLSELLVRAAQRLPKGARSGLLQSAAQLRDGVRSLTTLHYLLTGRRLRLHPLPTPPAEPVPSELRRIWARLKKASGETALLERDFQEYAEDLRDRRIVLDRARRSVSEALKGNLR